MNILEVQKALAAKSFDPGAIDGIWGRRTVAAVRAFQAAKGLLVDGVVGPATLKVLGLTEHPPEDPADEGALLWFQEARRLRGVREILGRGNSGVIIDWADNLRLDYDADDVPWCGLFVAHCIGSTLTSEPLPANPLSARGWRKFGARCEPQVGAVMVFWRGKKDGWQGHVGFYAGQSGSRYLILGGNQNDSVNETWLDKKRLLEARWPSTVPQGAGIIREVDDRGKVSSTDEQ